MNELIFHRLLVPAAERHAEGIAFIDVAADRQVTFGDHLERVARLTSGLGAELGVKPADRVAVLAMNSLSYIEFWHAALLGGAVINPLNLRFSDEELAFVLADSGSRVCVVDATFAERVDRVRAKAGIEHVVLCGEGDVPHDIALDDIVSVGVAELPPEPDEHDICVLMYTGGTTGLPKGVVLEQRAEILNQYHFAMAVPWVQDWRFLLQTPLFHGASMLGIMGAPAFGVTSVLLPAFDPVACMETVERFGIGFTVMVPTMITMVLSHSDFTPARLAALRRLVYGASPIPTALLERLAAVLPELEIIQGYGMTEGSTLVSVLTGEDHRRGGELLTSAGRAVPGVEMSIRDAGGAVAVGQVGEVCIRGGNFLREYWNRPDETAAALRDGWYHSGDVGYLDADGYLFLVDRAKDMIVTGGENVYCAEVENAIASHADVAQVAVIGIPDDRWGEAVHAVIVPRPGTEPTADDIIAHARASVAGYKVPKSVSFRKEPLPLSAVMKVLKRELRAPFWEGRERAIN